MHFRQYSCYFSVKTKKGRPLRSGQQPSHQNQPRNQRKEVAHLG
nr:MAG TPA: hypothetical protein [Caudoviricetes sp.]